ncbi:putative DsbA family dithiol-disulfide isomerase [Streptosporangium becharense]|uniref:Putative DsbA family dithiol-disulfide isomerase n=1 Tax=Streptosporangium becharense TaxID=1816182 RepID=A0A7W9IG77_9ACTN|nr:DsbA family protein [Streptosporangium becharense]MBB2909240.1 putative DsbA family dithiol-disulfide isomerase [Streptosporangium becharense]MBB5819741.1 putative DsbA family dithiol-disulfide isomerase [Streptosporangium becharense]
MKRMEVWADMTCPWAYIGKRRMEEAGFGEDVEIVWCPYVIDPMAPTPSEPLEEALRDPVAEGALRACASGSGGPGRGSVWRVNTFDAHRVAALAYERGGAALQGTVVERILHAHFVEGADIGDRATLAALAAEAGLDGVAGALDRGEGAAGVRSQLLRGKALGVATSPTFVVGETAVAGAQSPEVLADLVRHAAPPRELPDEVRLLRQAESLLGVRDPLGALRTLEPLLAEHGDDPSVRLLAARAYFGSAQLGRARQTLESLLENAPGDHYARFLLGRTLERANRHPEALPHLRLAAAMSPEPSYAEAVRRVESRIG